MILRLLPVRKAVLIGMLLLGIALASFLNPHGIQAAGTSGSVDPSFHSGSGPDGSIFAVAIQSDGKIIIGGNFFSYNGTRSRGIARLNTDGSLDTSFDGGGAGVNNSVYAVAIQSDGKIIIGENFIYNDTFGERIVRLNTDGSLDTSFNASGLGVDDSVAAVAIQSDGKIIIGGFFLGDNGTPSKQIARLNTDGSFDTSFNAGGAGPTSTVQTVTIQSDGKIIIGESFSYNGTIGNRIARLNTDGSFDTNFNVGGAGVNGPVYAVAIQSDGKILIGGYFTSYNGTPSKYIARLNTDGSLDTSFDAGGTGVYDLVAAVAIQSNGKIIIVGDSTSDNSSANNYIARLNNSIAQPTITTLTASPNPASFGQSITFTATVNPITATGTVSFTFDTGPSISATLSGGNATYVTSTLLVGSHTITATYGGDSAYSSSFTTTTQVVNQASSAITLTSIPNPSVVSQTVTFTATVSPVGASGTVTFSEGTTVLGTAPVVSSTAVYTTASLSIGSHVITATYSGDTTYGMAVSQPVTQVVQAPCAPLVVTAVTDDGSGTNCGTLSYALSQPITGSTAVTVTFALTQGNTITFTGSLTTTAKVKAGVTIYGGAFGSSNRIILNGNGVAGDGLHLAGHDYLVNLTIKKFGGRELVLEGTGNRMQGVVVDAS